MSKNEEIDGVQLLRYSEELVEKVRLEKDTGSSILGCIKDVPINKLGNGFSPDDSTTADFVIRIRQFMCFDNGPKGQVSHRWIRSAAYLKDRDDLTVELHFNGEIIPTHETIQRLGREVIEAVRIGSAGHEILIHATQRKVFGY